MKRRVGIRVDGGPRGVRIIIFRELLGKISL